ncbi:uncharacterized protein LOC118544112 [Halichoerus grypus]
MAKPSPACQWRSSVSGHALLPAVLWMKPEPLAVAIRLILGSRWPEGLSAPKELAAAWAWCPIHPPQFGDLGARGARGHAGTRGPGDLPPPARPGAAPRSHRPALRRAARAQVRVGAPPSTWGRGGPTRGAPAFRRPPPPAPPRPPVPAAPPGPGRPGAAAAAAAEAPPPGARRPRRPSVRRSSRPLCLTPDPRPGSRGDSEVPAPSLGNRSARRRGRDFSPCLRVGGGRKMSNKKGVPKAASGKWQPSLPGAQPRAVAGKPRETRQPPRKTGQPAKRPAAPECPEAPAEWLVSTLTQAWSCVGGAGLAPG